LGRALKPCPERSEGRRLLKEIAGLRGLEDQAALLQEAQSGRARAEARCRELTSEVERLSAAGEALEALESLVRHSH